MLSYPNIDPVAIAIGPVKVHWYGIMYLVGFAAAWWLGNKRASKPDSVFTTEQVSDLIFYGALGAVLGGRFGYVIFYNWATFVQDPLWLFEVWTGGMSFHGGLLGVGVAIWLFARKTGHSYFTIGDFLAPLVPIGLGAGRLGNFIGGELWGRATDAPWGMIFPADRLQLVRHPSQLYQLVLEGIVLFTIVWWFSSKPRPKMSVSGLFIACYGLQRFVIEFFRQPDSHIGFDAMGWLTRGQILSSPMVVIGIFMMVLAYSQANQQAQQPTQKRHKGSKQR